MKWFRKGASDEDKVLFDSKWHKIKQTDDEYQYIENVPGVAVLPFRITDNGKEFLIRDEDNPLFDNYITIITGRIDEGEEPEDAAIRELEEEAGIKVEDRDKLQPLGNMIISKDHRFPERLYIIDVTGLEQKEPEGDGTGYEANSTNFWVDEEGFRRYSLATEDSYLSTIACKYMLNGDDNVD